LNSRHVGLIAKYSVRYSLRGGVGLVFLLLSMTFGLMVAHTTLQPVELATKQAVESSDSEDPDEIRAEVLDMLVDQASPTVSWFLSERDKKGDVSSREAGQAGRAWSDYLLRDRPAILSVIFLVLLAGWPLIVVMGAFDLYAGDIASRQLRYQLLRADRPSIYWGRLIGTLITLVLVLFLLGFTVTGYMGIKLPHYDALALVTWGVYGVLALAIASLPYLTLSAWISTSIGSAFGSLTVASLVVGAVPLFAMFGQATYEPAKYVAYLLPWGYQMQLFHPDPTHVGLAVLGCLAHAALFGWLGARKFGRRDL
jgi:ABC-type transport system involved in multi-copper enzyme maturation permease subunit